MGFRYIRYKSTSSNRRLSPVRSKRISSSDSDKMRVKPRIIRPSSPDATTSTEDSTVHDECEPDVECEAEKGDDDKSEKEESEDDVKSESEESEGEEPETFQEYEVEEKSQEEDEAEEIVPPKSTIPPSPKRAKFIPLSPKRKKRNTRKKTTKKKKKRPDQVINPETGRPISIGGKVYLKLVENGVITPE